MSPLELHPNAVSQPIKINGKSFVDVTLRVDVLFDIINSATGDRKVPRTEEAGAALHMLGALH